MNNTQEDIVILPQGSEGNLAEVERQTSSRRKSAKSTELPQMPTLAAIEREYILRVLSVVGGSKEKAAMILGISVKSVYNKYNKYFPKTTKQSST